MSSKRKRNSKKEILKQLPLKTDLTFMGLLYEWLKILHVPKPLSKAQEFCDILNQWLDCQGKNAIFSFQGSFISTVVDLIPVEEEKEVNE